MKEYPTTYSEEDFECVLCPKCESDVFTVQIAYVNTSEITSVTAWRYTCKNCNNVKIDENYFYES